MLKYFLEWEQNLSFIIVLDLSNRNIFSIILNRIIFYYESEQTIYMQRNLSSPSKI